MRIFLGEYPVIENKLGAVTIDLGRNVTITIHVTIPCSLKPGNTLPLYTDIEDRFLQNVNPAQK